MNKNIALILFSSLCCTLSLCFSMQKEKTDITHGVIFFGITEKEKIDYAEVRLAGNKESNLNFFKVYIPLNEYYKRMVKMETFEFTFCPLSAKQKKVTATLKFDDQAALGLLKLVHDGSYPYLKNTVQSPVKATHCITYKKFMSNQKDKKFVCTIMQNQNSQEMSFNLAEMEQIVSPAGYVFYDNQKNLYVYLKMDASQIEELKKALAKLSEKDNQAAELLAFINKKPPWNPFKRYGLLKASFYGVIPILGFVGLAALWYTKFSLKGLFSW